MPAQVHAPGAEADPFRLQATALQHRARARPRRDASARPDDAVPGDGPRRSRIQGAQRPPDGAGSARHAHELCDLPVGGDAAAGDGAHRLVHAFEERHRRTRS